MEDNQFSPASSPSSGAAFSSTSRAGFRPGDAKARHACSGCARVKARCAWSDEAGSSTSCQSYVYRCRKYNLDCTPREIRPRKARGKSTRVVQLEQKVDGIMQLLTASQHLQLNMHDHSHLVTDDPAQPPIADNSHAPQTHVSPRSRVSFPTDHQPPKIGLVPGFSLTLDQGNKILHTYREKLTPHFPFVPLSPLVNAAQLHERSPVLFHTIILVTAPQVPKIQEAMKHAFRKYIAEQMIIQNYKTLELLQALLLYISWCDFRIYFQAQGTDFLQLAIALVMDLGLRNPPGHSWGLLPQSLVEEAALAMRSQGHRGEHTLEDKRVVLGCFYLATLTSTLFRRPQGFAFNDYLAKCCDDIGTKNIYSTDLQLVALVRIQRLLARVNTIFPLDSDGRGVYSAPHALSTASIRKELEALVDSQPEAVKSNYLFWTHYHNAIVRIYEPAVYMEASVDGPQVFQRSEALWNCLQSSQSFFESHFLAPMTIHPVRPFTWTACVAFGIVTFSRLLHIENSPDWDVELARKTADFASVVERLSDQFDELERLVVADPESSPGMIGVNSFFAQKIRWIKNWYLSRIPKDADLPLVPPGSFPELGNPDIGSLWGVFLDTSLI
ncbi:uncharacterized protein BCR38DRAFT_394838 [Pseudomassariella vexata]|uniref:Xylanolytic transcriptional activator regulatory domain-containing protein n=1 Tax=Pseudomassariella vexata TaxID=1141098 RepID=A0A1Y2DSM3_9PEZI|nr:uncharacterized protein BCR38DRAFT_394838 [Pseudomassariella vexata]ORY62154.1 hypothetical protein BCR38DRAFT_394838 [Pseudomassariella vexata]